MAFVGMLPGVEYGDRAEGGRRAWCRAVVCEGISMLATACPGSHKMQGLGLILPAGKAAR